MRLKLGLILVASALAGCTHPSNVGPEAGLSAVNVPVVSRNDYVLDVSAPGGSLASSETSRLDAWFRTMQLRYGDVVYVDGPYADSARAQVAGIAGHYGLLVSPGSPVTHGAVPAGMVRVVVSRTEASVPGCPNWERPGQPNYENRMLPNYGCGVNSNLAAMVADPQDLVHGREGSSVSDTMTATKAVGAYRQAEPTGNKGLQDISTKKGE